MTRLACHLSCTLLAIVLPLLSFAQTRSGSIYEDETWRLSDSPVTIDGTFTIENKATLTIEPGVDILLAPQSVIIVHGRLLARGTAEDSIRFSSADEKKAGTWGGIFFRGAWGGKSAERPAVMDAESDSLEEKPTVTEYESVLEYCVVEYAGAPVDFGASIEITDSSPLIANSTIRNCAGQTGTLRCCSRAKPLIRNCLFIHNSALRGGAVSACLNAGPTIKDNSFIFNRSEDHGGAIYISLSTAELTGNRFLGNEAGAHGGAIYSAIIPTLLVHGNSFIGNRARSGSNSLYLTSRFSADIKDNVFDTFESIGFQLYLENAAQDVDVALNFWGDPTSFEFKDIIRDRRVDIAEPYAYYEPFYWAPPVQHPTNPSAVDSIILCRDDNYSEEIPRGVAEGAPLRIRLAGVDTNPLYRDVVRVTVTSQFDPDGIVIPLRETAINSGVWIGRGQVAKSTDQQEYMIGGREGGKVDIRAPFAPEATATYPTMSPKPLAENLTIANTGPADIMHLIDHRPVFIWGYFDVIESPQLFYKLKVFPLQNGLAADTPLWDTGDVKTEEKEAVYTGPDLVDGERYLTRLNVWNGRYWSDTVELEFRMNSLPTAPDPDEPMIDELVSTVRPEFIALPSVDKEGDSLTYKFEVYSLDDSTLVSSASGIKPSESQVNWIIPTDLTENRGYNFHVKASDPLEEGHWSDFSRFWINSVEEPADSFGIYHPPENAEIYQLHPTFKWGTAVDPDPLSEVHYSLEISFFSDFRKSRIYSDLSDTSFTAPDSLDNQTTYFWRVRAIDNTGRETVSSSTTGFFVDTTPSSPLLTSPLGSEERTPVDTLTWEACSDPDPDDIITYEVEVCASEEFAETDAGISGWRDTFVTLNQLDRWEELIDNHVYLWRVRARDNHNAASELSSVGSFFYNRYNDPPSRVEDFSSPPDTVTGTTDIQFVWTPGSDPDLSDPPSSLVYELQCSTADFEAALTEDFTSGAGAPELTAHLDDNLLWRYRVRARDDEGAVSPWSEVDSVLVNFAEDPPSALLLKHPRDDSLVVELDSLIFTWSRSSDPDWESSITYRLELKSGEGESFTVETPDTFYNFREGLDNEAEYSWQVTAVDNIGLETVAEAGFGFRTNSTPSSPAAAPMPAELMPADPIAWSGAVDPNPHDRLTYTIEISGTVAFDSVLLHVEGLPHSEGINHEPLETLDGEDALEDDADYFFRVRATDNHGFSGGFSEPVQFRFNRYNDPPGLPREPHTPADSTVIRDLHPQLSWTAAEDEDLTDPPEKLIYDIRLDHDGEFKKDLAFQFSTALGHSEFTVPDELLDNTLWSWQARTRDDDGAVSDWSTIHSFLVNVAEDPPSVPQLTTPGSGELFNHLGPIDFRWTASEDMDFLATITYRIGYGTSEDQERWVVVDGLVDPSYRADYPLLNTTYYWRVTAVDNTGLETASSIGSFTLDTRPSAPVPLSPQPVDPIPLAELSRDGVIIWSKSKDPNPKDRISYTVQVGVDLESDTTEILTASDIVETSLPVATWEKRLKDNQVYDWRVRAIDEHGIKSDWSERFTFFYNSINDNPGPVSGEPAPSGDAEVSTIRLDWGAAADADISDTPDRISYVVEMSDDPRFSGEIRTFTTRPGETSLAPSGLTDEIRWYWRVRAVDNEGAEGPVSTVNGFIYNSSNDPPGGIPGLISPAEAAEVSSIELAWQAASDRDLTDSASVAYRVELCRDRSFNRGIVELTTRPMVTTAAPTGLEDDSWWFWRVRAVDDDGAEGPVSEVAGFIYNSGNDAPGQVTALPSPGVDEEVAEVTLIWEAAEDSDISDSASTLSYVVELSTNESFDSGVKTFRTEQGATSITPSGLADDSYWYWRVRAVDDDGVQGQNSEPKRFIHNTRNDPPGRVPALLKPVEGREVSVAGLEWEHAPDRDITDTPERLTYIVELCQDKSFNAGVITRNSPTGSNSLPVDGLADDGWWYWRVRARDDEGAEGPVSPVGSFIFNTSNDPPGQVAELLRPADGAEVKSVDLSWSAANDRDITDTPESLTYKIEFSTNQSFTENVTTITTQPGATSAQPRNLADNTTWYWRVSAVDDDGAAGIPSVLRSFTYNSREDPPDRVPGIVEPVDEATVSSVSLGWRAAGDPDPSDTPGELGYEVELSTDKGFASGVVRVKTEPGTTTATPSGLADNSVWYWRVRAVDKSGLKGDFSTPARFTLNLANDPPDGFSLLAPAKGSVINGRNVKLTWEKASDPDPGDRVGYMVVIARDAGFTTGLGTFRDISSPEFPVPADVTGEGGKLYWKVAGIDGQGAVTWGSDSDAEPWDFTVKPTPAP